MNQNKFLNNLHQKPAPPASSSGSPPTEGSDPVQRLSQELSRHSQAIERLSGLLEQWGQRPSGATSDQLTELLEAARKGVSHSLDSAHVAHLLVTALKKDLPSLANLQSATEQAVEQIQTAGQASADQIGDAGREAVSQIKGASRQQAHSWVGRIGFINWQSALLMWGLLVVLGGSIIWYVESHQAEMQAMRTQDDASREFVSWIQEKYPQVWKAYLKKVAP